MTVSMMRNTIEDAKELWALEAADFLHYVVEVSSPITVDEWDETILDAFKTWYEAEQALNERVVALIAELGESPHRPGYTMDLGYYNYARAEVLVRKFGQTSAGDLEYLESLRRDYLGCTELDERKLLKLLDDFIALRKEFVASGEKALQDASAGRAAAAAAAAGAPVEAPPEEEEAPATLAEGDDYPWHDEDLAIEERMELAKSGTLFDKLFAAMAQTDCTACGYDCEGYARAISNGEDADLSKCSPGEQETEDMLVDLVKTGGK